MLVNERDSAAMPVTERSAGVTPELSLINPSQTKHTSEESTLNVLPKQKNT